MEGLLMFPLAIGLIALTGVLFAVVSHLVCVFGYIVVKRVKEASWMLRRK